MKRMAGIQSVAGIVCLFLLLAVVPVEPQFVEDRSDLDAVAPVEPLDGPLDGAFVVPEILADSQVNAHFDEMRGLGMDTIIIGHIRKRNGACDSNSYAWLPSFPGRLKLFLDAAAARGMNVYVGLVISANGNCRFWDAPQSDYTISDSTSVAYTISALYGQHPAFAGWYIPNEPGLAGWATPSVTYPHYKGIVQAIRAVSGKPIAVSPYLGGVGSRTPDVVAQRALDFKTHTGVDLQIWQDSVGAASIDIGWGNRGYSVAAYFNAIANRIGRAALWADIELYNEITHGFTGGGYRPTSMARLIRQLDQTAAASKKVCWLQQAHMSAVANPVGSESRRLLASYKGYSYSQDDGRLEPSAYHHRLPPAPQYPDSGQELFDNQIGPTSFYDSRWSARIGAMEIEIDLGVVRAFDRVSTHVLNYNTAWIGYPISLGAQCSVDGLSWTPLGTWNRPFVRADGTAWMGNPSNLAATCRYVRVRLVNDRWTFLSEVRIERDIVVPHPKPASYSWLTAPSGSYPDSGSEMFDGRLGPANFTHPAWTARIGTTAIVSDFGATKDLDRIAVHTLNNNAAWVGYPNSMAAWCSTNNQTWSSLGTWNRSFSRTDGTRWLTSASPLNARCRYVKVQLNNDKWTFVSEIDYQVDVDEPYIQPASYQWITPPSPSYPDRGNEMFNRMVGDPLVFRDEEWTARWGSAELQVDLGKSQKVDWVGAHVLHESGPWIQFPSSMRVQCSVSGTSWTTLGTTTRPVPATDSELVFTNSQRLNATCRYLRLRFENSRWTFVSEIEISRELRGN